MLNADHQEKTRREEQQHQEHIELMESFGQLQQQMSTWEADREAERREHAQQIEEINKAREADKEELRREFLSMMQAANGQAPFQQIVLPTAVQPNNNVDVSTEVAAAASNMSTEEEKPQSHPEQSKVGVKPRAASICTTRSSKAGEAHSVPPAAYVSSQQLLEKAANRRRQNAKKTRGN